MALDIAEATFYIAFSFERKAGSKSKAKKQFAVGDEKSTSRKVNSY